MATQRSPTHVVMIACLAVFFLQVVGRGIGFGVEWFGVGLPLVVRPWTIVTSIFSHASVRHLVVNLIAFWLFGRIVERGSSRLRFYGFVLVVGAGSGIAELAVGYILGDFRIVLGLSGVVFGLFGYFLTSNRVSVVVFDWVRVPWRWQLVIFSVVAVLVTVVTGADQVAVIAHFTGLLSGLVIGRLRLLRSTYS